MSGLVLVVVRYACYDLVQALFEAHCFDLINDIGAAFKLHWVLMQFQVNFGPLNLLTGHDELHRRLVRLEKGSAD